MGKNLQAKQAHKLVRDIYAISLLFLAWKICFDDNLTKGFSLSPNTNNRKQQFLCEGLLILHVKG